MQTTGRSMTQGRCKGTRPAHVFDAMQLMGRTTQGVRLKGHCAYPFNYHHASCSMHTHAHTRTRTRTHARTRTRTTPTDIHACTTNSEHEP